MPKGARAHVELYNQLVVGGAEIQTPVLDCRRFTRIIIVSTNFDGALGRALNVKLWENLTTELSPIENLLVTVPANNTSQVQIGGGYTTGLSWAGLPPFLSLRLVSVGVASARLCVWGEIE